MSPARAERLTVAIEATPKKAFAAALEWPGWVRAAKTEDAAIEALLAYADRFRPIAKRARLELGDRFEVEVVERLGGGSGTDFGVPSRIFEADRRRVSSAEADRLGAIVDAAWKTFDKVASGAPAELRKGPRGGGRDRDKMVGHVMGADGAYARELGLRSKELELGDREAYLALRRTMLDVLRQPSDGSPLAGRTWTSRYAARRVAWHAIDHAWEMEDRST